MPATPETIASHLASEGATVKAATLAHRLAAIGKAHKAAGQPNPVPDNMLIAETFKGIKSVHGSKQVQKDPVLTEDLRVMLRAIPDTLLGLRDRALLLVGFAGAFRRSELVSLDVADIAFKPEGLLLTIRRSKTDQEGQGREIAIPAGAHPETDAVRAVQAWLAASGIVEGPVFRSVSRHDQVSRDRLTAQSVALIVKHYVAAAGMDAAAFSGHSLRAGFVTSAHRAGVSESRIMRTTGHKSVEMVLKYVRRANVFQDNAAAALGL